MASSETPETPGTSYRAQITQVDCPFSVERGDSAGCFEAIVPKHYSDVAQDGSLSEDAPRLTLAINVLENFVSQEEPNPIVLIAGGPGQAATDFLGMHAHALHLRRSRGLVLIDQRGTGNSDPRLDCDDTSPLELDSNILNDPDLSPEVELTLRLEMCARSWIERGVDFNAFDTRSAALDLMAIRQGFGLDQWNLHGTSYGGRVVLDAMRVDPDGIRSAVLNSPQAIFPHFDRDFARSRGHLFRKLFEDCANDSYCSGQFGDLEAHLVRIHDHLAEGDMEIFLRRAGNGELHRVSVGWEEVLLGLHTHMNFSFGAEPIARYINELARVVEGRLSLNDDEVVRIFQNSLMDDSGGMAVGMHLAVRCREDVPAYDPEITRAAVAESPFFHPEGSSMGAFYESCDAFGTHPVDAAFHQDVVSDIPVLVLTGSMDPLTPTSWADKTADTLLNGQLVRFSGMAHDIYGTSTCAKVLTANFIDAPFAPVDDTCAQAYGPVFAPRQE